MSLLTGFNISLEEVGLLGQASQAAFVGGSIPEGWDVVTPKDLGLDSEYWDGPIYSIDHGPIYFTDPISGASAIVLKQGSSYIVAFRGADDPIEASVGSLELQFGTYIDHYDPLLNALRGIALSGADFAFTGASLGGGATNLMADIAGSAFGGAFAAATFVGFASPIIKVAAGILNVGFENDPAYKVINYYEDFASSLDHLVAATPEYMAGNWDGLQPPDLYAHSPALDSEAFSRVAQSVFYDFMTPDSVLIFDFNAGLVQDITPGRENTGAFYLGENVADSIAGRNGNDFIEGFGGDDVLNGAAGNDVLAGGAGNDRLEGGAGNDIHYGGVGIDTSVFSLSLSNYTVVRNGTLTTVSGVDGTDHLTSVEVLDFTDTDLSNIFFTGDFNGNGTTDLLLQNGSTLAEWLMNGTAVQAGSGDINPSLGVGWTAIGTGDFNHDNTDDLLLQNGQQLALWQMNGTSIIAGSGNINPSLNAGWMVAGVADFNHDNNADILLQNGQQLALREMDGTSIIAGSGDIGTLGAGWCVAGTGDFNHDNNVDILLQNGQQLAIWEMNGTSIIAGSGNINPSLNAGWMVAGVADFNHDNNADILLQNGQTLALWAMNGTSIIADSGNIGTLGSGWTIAGNGDFNNDGYSDLMLQNGQQLAEWLLLGTQIQAGSGDVGSLGSGWSLA